MTEVEACRLLCAELPPSAVGVRRALRAARYWGTFPRAYTAEHHQLGRAVLAAAPEALARFRGAALAAADGQLVVTAIPGSARPACQPCWSSARSRASGCR